MNTEVLLNDKKCILRVMENEGLESVLEDIIENESDPLLLVW